MKAKNLINWSNLSRLLTGGKESVRMNRVPKRQKPQVDELLKLITDWQEKYKT